jgi:hypothetical protein
MQTGAWVPWLDTVPEFVCDPARPFAQTIVPTVDTIRYTYVVDALLAAGKHVLCVGETGTGKTLTLAHKLLQGMPTDVQAVFTTLSARTSANQTQDVIGGCHGGLCCAWLGRTSAHAAAAHASATSHACCGHRRVQAGEAPQRGAWAAGRQALHPVCGRPQHAAARALLCAATAGAASAAARPRRLVRGVSWLACAAAVHASQPALTCSRPVCAAHCGQCTNRYERKPPCAFKSIIDTQVVGAMGPPGGGRNPVSARVLRHFNFLSFTELSDDSVGRIFTTILGAFLCRNFTAPISDLTGKVGCVRRACRQQYNAMSLASRGRADWSA